MPNDLYLIRLIHAGNRSVCPGERLWSASLLTQAATVRFLRCRNRDGFDVYIVPFAGHQNSGYVFVDLDRPIGNVLARMHSQGHEPCLVLSSSPGHLQVWIRVSDQPLPPALATAISKHLAHLYHADLASTGWCHLGRLAGFTNQKPARRSTSGHAPWVRVVLSQPGFATQSAAVIAAAQSLITGTVSAPAAGFTLDPPDSSLSACAAAAIYHCWLQRLDIPQRFPQPDWSIADKWIAKELLRCATPVAQVHAILRFGSPQFPRRHSDPDDYLRRTLALALHELSNGSPRARRGPSHPAVADTTPPAFPAELARPCVAP